MTRENLVNRRKNCGAARTPKGRVHCELPLMHEKNSWWPQHSGRDRAGRWHFWPAHPDTREDQP